MYVVHYGGALRFMSISLVDFCVFMKWLFYQVKGKPFEILRDFRLVSWGT